MAGPLQHPKKGSSQNPEVTYVQHYILARLALTEVEGCWSNRAIHSSQYIVDPDEVGDQDDLDVQDPGAPGVAPMDVGIVAQGPMPVPPQGHPADVVGEESMASIAESGMLAEMSVDSIPCPEVVAAEQPREEHGSHAHPLHGLPPHALQAAPLFRPKQSVGRGRTARDPRSLTSPHQYPFCQGAGKRSTWLSTQFNKFPRRVMVETAKAAHTLLVHQAVEGDLVPPQGDNILKVVQYVHYHRCRLTKWCLLSSKYTVEHKLTEDRRSLGASFAMAEIPDHIRSKGVCSTMADLQPVMIRSYAILEWEGVAALQRVAYVKILGHTARDLVEGSGQGIMETSDDRVSEWDEKSRQCCIPLDNLRQALLVVTPNQSDMPGSTGRWLLIPSQGKKFGLVYDGAGGGQEEGMPAADE